jgi:SAM-dependent methyltransferase
MTGGFPQASFARLAALEDRNYWFQARNRLIIWALRRHFPDMRSYLEVGCGTGCVLGAVERAFPEVTPLGGEMHAAGLEQAAGRVRRARLLQMNALRIPFRDAFDVVGCFDVLEHVPDDAQVLAQCSLALRDGGGLLLTVPQHRFLWSASDEYAGHVRRYRRAEVLARLAAAGFRPLLATSFVSLLLPAMWAARARHPRMDERYDPGAELKVGSMTNAVLGGVLRIERALIGLGARFPFGGSLLVAAQKKPHVDPVQ